MNRTTCLTLLAVLCCAQTARALTIVVGDHFLMPNVAGQVVAIFAYADGFEEVQALNFRAQLGDGGPAAGGSDITPLMVGNITGPGTIFEFNNVGAFDNSFPPSYVEMFTHTVAGAVTLVPGANLVGTLTIDTTGLTDEIGQWPLLLTGTVGGNTEFEAPPSIDLFIINGSIAFVPEPSSRLHAALGLIGLAAWGWRRKRRA